MKRKHTTEEETLLMPPEPKAQHTPGPWIWHHIYDGQKTSAVLLETVHRPIPCNDPVVFAVRDDWIVKFRNGHPDVNLIAAAPELLESLHWASENARVLGHIAGNLPDSGDKRALIDVLASIKEKADKAIAKAEYSKETRRGVNHV